MENNKNQEELERLNEEHEKKKTERDMYFYKGLLSGCMLMLVLVLGAAGFMFWQKQKAVSAVPEEEKKEEALKKQVESKAGAIVSIIEDQYLEGCEEEKLADGVYAGLVSSLEDPYSVYYTKEEYDSLKETASGMYCGVGALLQKDSNSGIVKVMKVYESTPAKEAGILEGDVIYKVEGTEISDMELSEAVTLIKGEAGTEVEVEVFREGETDYLDFKMERREISYETVEYQMLENEIGYIQITEFNDTTVEQFAKAKQELEAQGMKAMIVDLRDNPGGVLTAVCDVLRQILPSGMIVYTEDKNGERDEYTCDGSAEWKQPLAVLVNENSASAAEIFAGAVKDYGTGTLIGSTTYGKGIVQKIIDLKDGTAVKLTISKYYTPKGNNIHEIGIEPDMTLEYDRELQTKETYDIALDNQVNKAIEVIMEKLGQ